MRIDRLLCNLRFVRTRSLAAKLASQGHLRRNGARITRPSQEVIVGDVLTIPFGVTVRLVELLALPDKRGPARDAQACYRLLDQTLDRALNPMVDALLDPMLDRDGETDIGELQDTTTRGDARP